MSKEINKNHLMVCTPVHSDVSIHYMKACLDLQKECILNKTKITFQLKNDTVESLTLFQGGQEIKGKKIK